LGMSLKASAGAGRRRSRGGRRHAPMSEINVTPMVDVMLVLLIIFMVSAPLLTAGLPVDLPEAKGQQTESKDEPLTVSITAAGEIAIGETKVTLAELAPKLKAIAKNGVDQLLVVKADKAVPHGTVMQVMSRLSEGGFKRLTFLTSGDQG